MYKKLGLFLTLLIALAGGSGARAEEDRMWMSIFKQTYAYEFHPNSETMAVANYSTVLIIDVQSGNVVDTLFTSELTFHILSLSFNSTGTKLAGIIETPTYNPDNYAKAVVWDMETKQLTTIDSITSFNARMSGIKFSPNDSLIVFDYLVSGSEMGIKIAKASDLSILKSIKINHMPEGQFSISRDSKYIAYSVRELDYEVDYSTLYIYNIETDQIVKTIYEEYASPKFSPAKDELFLLKYKREYNNWYLTCIDVLETKYGFNKIRTLNCPEAFIDDYDISSDGNFITFGADDIFTFSSIIPKSYFKYNFPSTGSGIVRISPNLQYIASRSISMFHTRLDSTASINDPSTYYFSYIQDTNNSFIKIIKQNSDIVINSITINDINGNQVTNLSNDSLINNEIIINTDAFVSGTYYMNINTNNGTFTHSFVIVR